MRLFSVDKYSHEHSVCGWEDGAAGTADLVRLLVMAIAAENIWCEI